MTAAATMTVAQVLRWGEQSLSLAGAQNCKMESLWLLAASLQKPCAAADLYMRGGERVSSVELRLFEARVAMRMERRPLAYILGSQDFMGMALEVNESVLIPRPETELLAEEAARRVSRLKEPLMLDVGTGSGCLTLALAKLVPNARLIATDVSEKALAMAKRNAERLNLAGRITFLQGNLFHALEVLDDSLTHFDLIVSNPPYIRSEEIPELQPEVQYEPRLALDGGTDGFNVIQPLVQDAYVHLKPDGFLMMEIGHDQGDGALKIMENTGFRELGFIKDYSGIERIVLGKRKVF